jgi:hypothetical protein
MVIWIAAGVLGLLGIVFTFAGVRGAGRRPVSGGFGALVGLGLLGAGGVAALLGVNLRTYERLTAEQVAARIEFDQTTTPGRYAVVLQTADEDGQLGEARTFELDGQQWLMGARIIKFPGWANVAGLDAVYRLEVVTSFSEEWIQQGSPQLLNEGRDVGVDVWALARSQGKIVEIDASYGNAAYGPMADGAVFEVSVSQSGLVSRPISPQATEAVSRWDGRTPPPSIPENLIVQN